MIRPTQLELDIKTNLPQPMPCSPVPVPSRESARWTGRSLIRSASAISLGSFGLSTITKWKLPPPTWHGAAFRSEYSAWFAKRP